MTLGTYSNGPTPSTHPRRRPLVGTAHKGEHWVNALRILPIATQNAVQHAGHFRKCATPDQVGSFIIDHIDELDHKALHVLAVMFSDLVREARRD